MSFPGYSPSEYIWTYSEGKRLIFINNYQIRRHIGRYSRFHIFQDHELKSGEATPPAVETSQGK
jgi:hypothetical protein